MGPYTHLLPGCPLHRALRADGGAGVVQGVSCEGELCFTCLCGCQVKQQPQHGSGQELQAPGPVKELRGRHSGGAALRPHSPGSSRCHQLLLPLPRSTRTENAQRSGTPARKA